MTYFVKKTPKSESIDKTPYTVYYPHTNNISLREWSDEYIQVVSIDPARKNFAIRIERRYKDKIVPIVFHKAAVDSMTENVCDTYKNITNLLDNYLTHLLTSHYIIIERQLPQNYKATRIAQHTISYFCIKLYNNKLLSSIIEIDPKLKGKMLGASRQLTDKQLKSWAVEKARSILTLRNDTFSLSVLDKFKTKQDDLSDTICQIEAYFLYCDSQE